MTKHVQWDGNLNQEGFEILKGEGGCIVTPTKVGYIIMTSDKAGLERKFEAKERNRNKPGVVLCGSMDELRALAQLTPEIDAFYQKHWDEDILLGCILPWREDAYAKLQAFGDGREELMTDARGTSCFVIKFGKPGEQIAKEMWEKEGKMVYASALVKSAIKKIEASFLLRRSFIKCLAYFIFQQTASATIMLYDDDFGLLKKKNIAQLSFASFFNATAQQYYIVLHLLKKQNRLFVLISHSALPGLVLVY